MSTIRRDDYVGNAMRLNEFLVRRELAKLGKPVGTRPVRRRRTATLPIVINAAYDPSWNGIEIPAAFLQPPFYDAKADPAVNYCTMGAVIGHELTHGFDSSGRLYDATGNVRDWWTPADAQRFVAEAGKLAKQADAFEILPGLRLNGAIEVTENLADVGGVALGYAALQEHLREHPAANRTIDGFTPSQRCFLAWGQLWAAKANEGALRQTLPVDGHPPGVYRMAAPSQHERASTRRSASARATACGSPRATASRSGEERHEYDDQRTFSRWRHAPRRLRARRRSRPTGRRRRARSACTFAKGASSATIKGTLKGGGDVDYVVRAAAGQTLEVKLDASNGQNNFNVLPPGSANVAMYSSNMTGERTFRGVLPADGDYAIRVYLIRAAARRNESSKYTLTVAVTGKALPPLSAARDAKVAGTAYHATAKVPCALPYQPEVQVVRRGCGPARQRRHGDLRGDRQGRRAAAHPVRAGQAGRDGRDGTDDGDPAGRHDRGEGRQRRALRHPRRASSAAAERTR